MIQKKNGKSVEDSIRFYSQFKCVKRIHIVDLIGAKAKEVKRIRLHPFLKKVDH